MYLTRDKVVFEPWEHITTFPKELTDTKGYIFLKTESEDKKYGVNTTSVYMKRNAKIESYKKGESENPLDNKEQLSYLKKKLLTLNTIVLNQKICNAYQTVHIFSPYTHYVYQEWNRNNNQNLNYKNYCQMEMESYPEFDKMFEELVNTKLVLCDKKMGERFYNRMGVELQKEDMDLLQLKKGRK